MNQLQRFRQVFSTAAASFPSAWVFLGPPGVGKGTYSKRIAESLGMVHIAAGDLVRSAIKEGTDLGKEMRAVVNRGDISSPFWWKRQTTFAIPSLILRTALT